MSRETNTHYAILGLLTTGCQTGYTIKQLIDGSLNHFWKISYGQVYPTLKQLLVKGYATVKKTEQEGKPDKKVYEITHQGEQALKQWLQNPIQELPTEKNELLLKLFFSRHQELPLTIEHLDIYFKKLTERYHTYEGIQDMIHAHSIDKVDAPYWLMTLDFGLKTTKAAIDWCEETKRKLLNQKEES